MKEKMKRLVANKRYVILLVIVVTVISNTLLILNTKQNIASSKSRYTEYNNYVIFKHSFFHLKNGQDLYKLYPEEHHDLYKYTPTFAAAFGFFAVMPDWLGLNLWNIFNVLILALAIYYLPKFNSYQKGLILLILMNELYTSIQSSQTNALITGLLIFTFVFLENKKLLWASLFVVLSVYVKLFGILGFALFLFYPKKWKLALYSAMWTVVLFLVPLVFVGFKDYVELFSSYGALLLNDHSGSYGYSVMGIIHSWFNIDLNKNAVVLLGAVIFLIPLVRVKMYRNYIFKYLTLVSILLWLIIFNHKAESPTFIIAMTGVAMWFINGEKSKLNITLFICALVLTSLSPTDIFPPSIRENFFEPYAIKALPCILIWCKVIYDMLTMKDNELLEVEAS